MIIIIHHNNGAAAQLTETHDDNNKRIIKQARTECFAGTGKRTTSDCSNTSGLAFGLTETRRLTCRRA